MKPKEEKHKGGEMEAKEKEHKGYLKKDSLETYVSKKLSEITRKQ